MINFMNLLLNYTMKTKLTSENMNNNTVLRITICGQITPHETIHHLTPFILIESPSKSVLHYFICFVQLKQNIKEP